MTPAFSAEDEAAGEARWRLRTPQMARAGFRWRDPMFTRESFDIHVVEAKAEARSAAMPPPSNP